MGRDLWILDSDSGMFFPVLGAFLHLLKLISGMRGMLIHYSSCCDDGVQCNQDVNSIR